MRDYRRDWVPDGTFFTVNLLDHRLDLLMTQIIQAVSRHDVGLAAENAGGLLVHVRQLEQTQLAPFGVENRSTSDPHMPAARHRAEPIVSRPLLR
jgi:hypothetical protein